MRGGLAQVMTVAARLNGPKPQLAAPVELSPQSGAINVYAKTDTGQRRDHNEDSYMVDREHHVYGVADGMGGAAGGEIASQMAVQGVLAVLADMKRAGFDDEEGLFVALPEAIRVANRRIFARAGREPQLAGMGTTLTVLGVASEAAYIAHVGDSRAFRVRRGEIEQLSDDHTYVNEIRKVGHLSAETLERLPNKHVLVRAVGVEAEVQVDVLRLPLQSEDQFVLCSDGLTNCVSSQEILQVLSREGAQAAPQILVDMANHRGGPDNITVVVVAVP